MKSFFKIIAYILCFIALILAGLFYYFIYFPEVPEPSLPGSFESKSLELNGLTRTYSFYQPSSLKTKAPLIFVLHGSISSGAGVRLQTGYEFDLLAEKFGFVVVYPDGYENHWNDCRASADYVANTQNIDDVAFFDLIVKELGSKLRIDKSKVFATGFSNGGHMAYRLGLEHPDQFSGVAAFAANLPVKDNLDCEPSGQPVSIAIFNGTEDPINPHTGGLVSIAGNSSRGEVLSSSATAAYWLGLAGVDGQPVLVQKERVQHAERDGDKQTSVEERRWSNSDGIQVRLYTLQGSGHVMPSYTVRYPRIIGPEAGDISGPEEVVNFFLGE
jgi:polyhydroxybutyrate depolymerase